MDHNRVAQKVGLFIPGSRFKQNKALMQPPDAHLEIPQDEDLKDVTPSITKPPKVLAFAILLVTNRQGVP